MASYDWMSNKDTFSDTNIGFNSDLLNLPAGVQSNVIPNETNNGAGGFNWSNFLFGSGEEDDKGFLIPGLQTASGLANAYTGYQNLKLGRDQFDFTKTAARENFGRQAQQYNTLQENAYGRTLKGTGKYENDPEGFKQALSAYVEKNKINPAAI
jgi:hypothetical protein